MEKPGSGAQAVQGERCHGLCTQLVKVDWKNREGRRENESQAVYAADQARLGTVRGEWGWGSSSCCMCIEHSPCMAVMQCQEDQLAVA